MRNSLKINHIVIRGAKEHNLKNIDVNIPRGKFIVITGLSGSGKSSLAFDTIYAEGRRRYVESLSAYARQFLGNLEKPNVDYIEGLSPAISIDQRGISKNPRSTVGTTTEIYDYLRILFARIGIPYSPSTGKPIESQSVSQIVDNIMKKKNCKGVDNINAQINKSTTSTNTSPTTRPSAASGSIFIASSRVISTL